MQEIRYMQTFSLALYIKDTFIPNYLPVALLLFCEFQGYE